jgi:hypothetical protein
MLHISYVREGWKASRDVGPCVAVILRLEDSRWSAEEQRRLGWNGEQRGEFLENVRRSCVFCIIAKMQLPFRAEILVMGSPNLGGGVINDIGTKLNENEDAPGTGLPMKKFPLSVLTITV